MDERNSYAEKEIVDRHEVDEKKQLEVRNRYTLEMQEHNTAVNNLNAARKSKDAVDSAEMQTVKARLSRVNSSLKKQIAGDFDEFKMQLLELSEQYKELISACETYLSAKSMAKYRYFTKGKKRYERVKALLAVAQKERLQIRNLGKNKELFDMRIEGAFVGTALVHTLRDNDALDSNVNLSAEGWVQQGNLRTKTIGDKKYTMSRRSGKKPDLMKKAAAAGRMMEYMGVEMFGNEPSLVLARDKKSAYYGMKELKNENMLTMHEIEEKEHGNPDITYSPNALKMISNIKLLKLLLGIENFDAKNDIAFSFEIKEVKGRQVYLINSAKICNFSKAFSKNITRSSLQREIGETNIALADKEMCDFIRDIEADDISFMTGDLLSKDQRSAFMGRLEFIKGRIQNSAANDIDEWGNGLHMIDSEDWEDKEIRDKACDQIMKDDQSSFSVLFGANCHVAGKKGDIIWDAEEEEKENARREAERLRLQEEERKREEARKQEEERKKEQQRKYEEYYKQQQEYLKQARIKAAEEERKRKEEEERLEKERIEREKEEARKRKEEEERLEKERIEREKEEARKRVQAELQRREEEERQRREYREAYWNESEKSRTEEEQKSREEKESKARKKEENRKKRKFKRDAKLVEEINKAKEEYEEREKEDDLDNYETKILSLYTKEEIKEAVINGSRQTELDGKLQGFLEQRDEIKNYGKNVQEILNEVGGKEYDDDPDVRFINLGDKKQAEVVAKEKERFRNFFYNTVKPFYDMYIGILKQKEICILRNDNITAKFDDRLYKADQLIKVIKKACNESKGDLRLIQNHKEYGNEFDDEMIILEDMENQRKELKDYLKELEKRCSPEARSLKKEHDKCLSEVRYAKDEDRSEEKVREIDQLTKELVELKNSGKEKKEFRERENEILADYKRRGLALEQLTEEEFDDIKYVNERFAYKLYIDYMSRNRNLLKKEIIEQDKDGTVMFNNTKVFAFSHKREDDGSISYLSFIKCADTKDLEKHDVYTDASGDIKCQVYPCPNSVRWTNNIKQGSENNYLGISGTCGPSSMSQIVNQIYGMNITNESFNLYLLKKFSGFNVTRLPDRDENGEVKADDGVRLNFNHCGGTDEENMSDILELFGIKHKVCSKEFPPVNSEENRDKATGLDNDLLLFAETLKKGGSVQVAIRADILWSKGEDPRKKEGFYDDKPYRLREQMREGRVYSNHWINLCNVCYQNGTLTGFIYKDTGAGESGFISAKLLDKAYRGIQDKDNPLAVISSEYVLVEKSEHAKEAECAMYSEKENQMLDDIVKSTDEVVQLTLEYTNLVDDLMKRTENTLFVDEEAYKKRREIEKAWLKNAAAFKELTKDDKSFETVKKRDIGALTLKQREECLNRVNKIWGEAQRKYNSLLIDKVKNANKTIDTEFPGTKLTEIKLLDNKMYNDFFNEWEKEIESADYTEEKHSEWFNKIEDMKKTYADAVKRYHAILENDSVNIITYKLYRSPAFFDRKVTAATKLLTSKITQLEAKHKDIFDKYKKPEVNSEEGKQVKA